MNLGVFFTWEETAFQGMSGHVVRRKQSSLIAIELTFALS